jgi:hypothetical protein
VQDSDAAVGGAAQGVVVLDAAGALSASTSRSVWMKRAATTFFFPDERVMGLVPA